MAVGRMRKAFDQTVRASEEVDAKLDAALVAAGRTVADQIDTAVTSPDPAFAQKGVYLMPHLVNILKAMLATPEARHEAGLSEKPNEAVSKLGQLRLAHRASG